MKLIFSEQAWEDYRAYYAMPPYPDRAALEMVVREELLLTSPKAADVPIEAYYDDHFVQQLVDSGFVRGLTDR